jgi:GNAT superfamily N-acetyltransferase
MIRPATPADVPALARLIAALAQYERLEHALCLDEERLRQHLFGPQPFAEVLVAEEGGALIGYALFFPVYSTFRCQPGLYLEDVFVRREARGRGHGKALLAAVARRALERGCGKLEWSVLDWNEPAIHFYQSLGAAPVGGWTSYRLAGDALAALAAGAASL